MNKIISRPTTEEHQARKTIMEVAYLCLSVFLFLIVILSGRANFASAASRVSFAVQVLIGVASLACFVLARRGHTMAGAYFLPYGVLLLTFALINSTGIGSVNALFFVTIVVIAGVTAGMRGVILFAALSVVSVVGLSLAQAQGLLANKTPVSVVTPAITIAHVVGDALVLVLLIRIFNQNLHRALASNQELRQLQTGLEQRIAERTRDLQIAADVSRQITRVLDLDVLLPKLVQKTRQGFNLYYVALYLHDQHTGKLTLEAGAGREGARMKSDEESLHISARPSVVAQAAREHKPEIINDTAQSAIYSFDPHLPDTRAEAAFPMLVSDELVGVLDMESETVGRFQESETQIFATLAEQIAIAVRNAQLYSRQEQVARELERTDLMKSRFLASMSH